MGYEDYLKLRLDFSLPIPENFSFPMDVFDPWAGRLGANAECLYWSDGSRDVRISFSRMTELSSKGAGFIRGMGISPGDPVLVLLPPVPEWWEAMLALMRAGAVPIPATTLLTAKDIEYRLVSAKVKAVITDEDNLPKVMEAIGNTPPVVITTDEYSKQRDKSLPFEGERFPAHSPALIYFTSGTTGPPKMVLHTQASYPLAHYITGRYWLDLRPGDVHWNLSDTGWAKAAWSSLFGPWHMGATIFAYHKKGKFDPLTVSEALVRYPVTTLCAPPTAYRMMVKEGAVPKSKAIRHFVAAGEPLNKEIINIWAEKTGIRIYDGYGQTETVNVLANLKCLPVKPGSMGVPVPGFDVEVVNDSGQPAESGQEGDIAIRVKPSRPIGLFKEYIGNRRATDASYRGDWYITGDRAYKDEDGYFWFVGRADDIILTSGYRIGPFEIESVLIEHPAVRESAVVSSPDEVRGEVVKAFIVLQPGIASSDALALELQEFVKGRTAPYKYPRKVEFVADLPKTISGKIKRKELKLKEWGKL